MIRSDFNPGKLPDVLAPHFARHPQSSPDGLYLVAVADDHQRLFWSDYERERAAADSLPPILWRENRV